MVQQSLLVRVMSWLAMGVLERSRGFEAHALVAILLTGVVGFVVHALLERKTPRAPAP